MNYNPCIYTGFTLVLLEYPAVVHGDLFLVGNCAILTGYGEITHGIDQTTIDRADGRVRAENSLIKDPQKFIAFPLRKLDLSPETEEKINRNLSWDGISL